MPGSFTALNSLEYLRLDGTELCAPTDTAFQAWVRGIRYKRGVVDCVSDTLDRATLVALYNATDGPNWVDKTNWRSNRPLVHWFGVDTDNDGRVTQLPGSLTALNSLEYLRLEGTGLRAPTDAAFQAWLGGIRYKRGVVDCASDALDRAALVALYNATDGPNWVDKTNWLSNRSFEHWFGVDTDNDGRVTQLSLSGNRLSGLIPSELSGLTSLTELFLGGNGSLLGPLPGSLTALTSLEYLRLEGTGLCAPTDAAFQAWLGGIRYKRGVVDCASDALDRAALVALYNATDGPNWVDKTNWLSNRSFEDWFGVDTDNDGRVTQLSLSGNRLSGLIPSELSGLTSLTELFLGGNGSLLGPLPGSLTALTSLEDLRLEGTGLCAPTDAAFQAWLGGITNKRAVVNCVSDTPDRAALVALYNATNGPNWDDKTNWLSSSLLGGWYGVDTDNNGRVTHLALAGNQLFGQIPSQLSDLTNLTELGLGNSQLSGQVPSELADLTNLTWLDLRGNLLSGQIPSELSDLTNVTYLALAGNELSGQVPSELSDLEGARIA